MGSSPLVGSSSKHQVGIVDEGLGQADTPGHALGILFQLPAAGSVEADHLDEGVGPLAAGRGGHVEQAAVKVERFLGVQEPVKIRLFRQVSDPLVFLDVGGGPSEDRDFPFGREEQPQQQLHGRRLTGTIGSQQSEHLARLDVQRQRIQGSDLLPSPKVSINLGKVPDLDDRLCRHQGFLNGPRILMKCGLQMKGKLDESRGIGLELGPPTETPACSPSPDTTSSRGRPLENPTFAKNSPTFRQSPDSRLAATPFAERCLPEEPGPSGRPMGPPNADRSARRHRQIPAEEPPNPL